MKNLLTPNYHQLQENEAGEFLLINRLIKHLAQPPFCQSNQPPTKDALDEKSKGLSGIGDDCAIIPSSIVGKYLLASVDSFIEGRHFLFNISTPEQIGYKSIATATSDIAAMGGNPRFALINLHLTKNFDSSIIEKIYHGIQEFCSQFGLFVIGGNTSSALEISISATIIGDCDAIPLTRNCAKDGDDFWISGSLGLSQMGLEILRDKKQFSVPDTVLKSAVLRYQRPEPQIVLGHKLLNLGATSAIDISDGIFQDAGHIALQSNLEIELDLSPLNQLGLPEKELISLLTGGGDYELLFSSPPELRSKIEVLSKELASDNELVRCGVARKVKTESKVLVKTTEGVISSTELVKKYGLNSPGNDHFTKK